MWIRKGQRDRLKGVDSPVPTQLVSNEEYIPRRQTQKQKEVEYWTGQIADEKSHKLGMDRRKFMATPMGLATCFLASNKVWGKVWDVDEDEATDQGAYEEKLPKGEYFVLDVQSHFTNGMPIGLRGETGKMEFFQNMGFKLKEDKEAYSFHNFIKEMFFDSETDMIVISGVPGKEQQRDKDGKVLEAQARTPGLNILPSWLMAQARDEINGLAQSKRALSQGNLAPNHYWDKTANKPDKAATIEQMERELNLYKVSSWKWYCHTDPGRSGGGFQCDDDNAQWFIEESRTRGMKIFSVHKGYSYQSRILGGLANPKDIEKAALRNPDITWVIYRRVAHTRHEDLQRAQGLLVSVAHPRRSGESQGHRKGRAAQPRYHLGDLSLRAPARPQRAQLGGSQQVRSGDRRLRLAQRPDGYQTPQSEDRQRVSGDRQLFRSAGHFEPHYGHARHRQEHQILRRGARDLGDGLLVVGIAAVGDRRL